MLFQTAIDRETVILRYATRKIGRWTIRCGILETLYIILLLGSIVVKSVECSVNSHGAVDVDENEFAEFEDEDEPRVVTSAPGLNTGQRTGGRGDEQPSASDSSSAGANSVDGGAQQHEEEFEEEEELQKPTPHTSQTDTQDDDGSDVVEEEDDDVDDEFSYLEDSDEFENFDRETPLKKDASGKKTKSPSTGGSSSGDGPQLKFADVPAHLRNNWANYQVELLMLFGLAIYLINYGYGKSKNQTLAQSWLDEHRDILEQQFSHIGDDGSSLPSASDTPGTSSSGSNGGGVIMQSSSPQWMRDCDHVFSLWCSGRVACQGMLVQLKLLKRQDIIALISQIMRPKYDKVIIRVDVDATEMDSYVFACGQRKSVMKLAKEMQDLSQFCSEKKSGDKFPSGVTVFSEIAEATSAILDPKVVTMFNKYEESIDYIHFSDQYSGPKPQEGEAQRPPSGCRALVFSFNIPGRLSAGERSIQQIKPLMGLVFHCLDKVRRFRLSREGKQRAERNRQVAQEQYLKTTHQNRVEAAQQRREDKAKERKQKLMEEEDPDKQRRLEKIEQKRDAKKNQPRMKQLKIKAM